MFYIFSLGNFLGFIFLICFLKLLNEVKLFYKTQARKFLDPNKMFRNCFDVLNLWVEMKTEISLT